MQRSDAMPATDDSADAEPGARDFRTTHWSVVLSAGQRETPEGEAALETLCRAYWMPLYFYVRRHGYAEHEAKDLTQEFFSKLIEKNYLGVVERGRGRFRYFLQTALKNFLANEWNRSQRQKRGGGVQTFSLDAQSAEDRYQMEAPGNVSPEHLFDKRWAQTLFERVMERLEQEFPAAGEKRRRFDELKPFLLDEPDAGTYAEVARRLNMNEGAVKSAVHRLRQRSRELFREEIAHTVSRPDEIVDEIQHLFAALSA
jgi:RNA polymerase sigma factor (sigma-70 family)